MWHRFVAPGLVFGLLCYATWVFCHKVCYDQIFHALGHKSRAIGLMCIVCFLDIVVIFIWYQIVILVGPGSLPRIPPYWIREISSEYKSVDSGSANLLTGSKEIQAVPKDNDLSQVSKNKNPLNDVPVSSHISSFSEHRESDELLLLLPPEIYKCDPNGYPMWCAECKSLKTDRAHHTRYSETCIPRFDHYCMWLGTPVGKRNYRLFCQFMVYMLTVIIIVFVSTCAHLRDIIKIHQRQNRSNGGSAINPNIAVLLIISGVPLILLAGLLSSIITLIWHNSTTIEHMAQKNKAFPMRNFYAYYSQTHSQRYVIELTREELKDIELWRKPNIWSNFADFWGPNVAMWIIPWQSHIEKKFFKGGLADHKTWHGSDYHSGVHMVKQSTFLGPLHESPNPKAILKLEQKISLGQFITVIEVRGDRQDEGSDFKVAKS